MSGSTLQDPTNSTRSTPNIDVHDAVLQIGSSALVAAPSTRVWAALLDTSTWPEWNTFVPRVTIRSQTGTTQADTTEPDSAPGTETPAASTAPTPSLSPRLCKGTRMTFHVRMDPTSTKPQAARDTHLVVTECVAPDPATRSPGRIVWVSDTDAPGGFAPSLLTAERVHEVVDVGGGEAAEVRNWELQRGYLVYVVKWVFGARLRRNFELWVSDLRAFVEKGSGSGSGNGDGNGERGRSPRE
ncbi:hypothetical protein N7539_007785 [Penicillium diatomitis]|uniref:Coenzyme Q-binding protein COQ10 START domain-containing protein n=1 Tax=Penicillium diatomitis TaxID=2819901 RepID=A0A9X0BNL3_9EURO|nr:uncharacterized protein N7539_007785 [Penicillium diatomitis]KAJ5475498.1 hypothetical protein N7539_007785 [Penicillium diatomitis]